MSQSSQKPALSLAAVPGRRTATLELAKDIEKRGFPGIFCPSLGDGLALCEALALVTDHIIFGTTITPIYTRHIREFAQTSSFIHEVSKGRFRFGIGVSHALVMDRLKVNQGKPLSDIRKFVEDLRAVPRAGELPPIVLATLRDKMIQLSEEIAEGMVFANGARSHMQTSLANISQSARQNDQFFIGNMIPTCISNDIEAAKAVNRKTLSSYAMLPNYRNYWKQAGYEEEMLAIEAAISNRENDKITRLLSDKWLADTTLFGTPSMIREGIEAWYDAGIRTPIIVPSSANGGQFKAFEEFFSIWD